MTRHEVRTLKYEPRVAARRCIRTSYFVLRTSRPAFTLIEAALSCLLVSLVFAAGMAAAGVAARDRRTQSDTRTGAQLAQMLLDEICQQRYADPSANTIAPAANASTTDRSNWTHIDDYVSFAESSPRDRTGRAIPGATGWKWSSTVAYTAFPTFAGNSSTAPSGGVVGGLLGVVTGTVSAALGSASSATDTGLKKITVTITSPSGATSTLTAYRSSCGAVDRVPTATGFMSFSCVTLTVGSDAKAVQAGVPLLNTPASP